MSGIEMSAMAMGPVDEGKRVLFTMRELRRVGTAATLVVVCGTIIILSMMLAMGHYNSLAHAGPKAVADGFVLTLLMGPRGRWRMLSLLGAVYGLVLVMQVGVVYLAPVMIVTGLVAAVMGWCVERAGSRLVAVMVAAAMYEWLAGFGAPIKIYFATDGGREPILWTMWMLEWPLRIVGAVCGVMLARRFVRRRDSADENKVVGRQEDGVATGDVVAKEMVVNNTVADHVADGLARGGRGWVERLKRSRSTGEGAVRFAAAMVACTLPMGIESAMWLIVITLLFVGYGLWLGMRKSMVGIFAALFWGWLMFGLASYAWHRDMDRVQELGRTLVLRFAPLAIASSGLVRSTRSVDLLRLLRAMRCPRMVLIPLGQVLRSARMVQMQWRAERTFQKDGKKGLRERVMGPLDRCKPLLVAWCDQLRREEGK